MAPRATLIPHPLSPLVHFDNPTPYRIHGIRVHAATCKTGIGASRSRMIPHLVKAAGVMWKDGKPVFGARWLCSSGAMDAVFLASAAEMGGVCAGCISVAAGPCVYRFRGHDGALLYIGSTMDRHLRFKRHEKKTPWWGSVGDTRCEDYPSVEQARAAEMAAIRTENPRHNRVGRLADKAAS